MIMFPRSSFFLLLVSEIYCHTWIEQLTLIDSNNEPIGTPGFIRGFVPRTSPGFTDDDDNYLVPQAPELAFQPSDEMCKPTQVQGNQTNGPVLTASPGSRILLRYIENGHITLPDIPPNKPTSGTVSVYATLQPHVDEKFLDVHDQWTQDGAGGDQRGFLINQTTFDDGQCYDFDPTGHSGIAVSRATLFGPGPTVTENPNRWCGTIVSLNDQNGNPFPSNTLLTLYWVWDWPTYIPSYPGTAPTILNETYTSCMEVQIV